MAKNDYGTICVYNNRYEAHVLPILYAKGGLAAHPSLAAKGYTVSLVASGRTLVHVKGPRLAKLALDEILAESPSVDWTAPADSLIGNREAADAARRVKSHREYGLGDVERRRRPRPLQEHRRRLELDGTHPHTRGPDPRRTPRRRSCRSSGRAAAVPGCG